MLTIYHNPRCSKSREALALLESRGQVLRVIDYLQEPLDFYELSDLLRTGEEVYAQLGLDQFDLPDETLLQAIAAHPQLLQRPIVVSDTRAVIARPPELALSVLVGR